MFEEPPRSQSRVLETLQTCWFGVVLCDWSATAENSGRYASWYLLWYRINLRPRLHLHRAQSKFSDSVPFPSFISVTRRESRSSCDFLIASIGPPTLIWHAWAAPSFSNLGAGINAISFAASSTAAPVTFWVIASKFTKAYVCGLKSPV